jgi:hypothetical protein
MQSTGDSGSIENVSVKAGQAQPLYTRSPTAEARLVGECVTGYVRTQTSSSAMRSAASWSACGRTWL